MSFSAELTNNLNQLQEAAFNPPPKNGRIVLVHDLLPWALTITNGANQFGVSTVVTVGHLLQTIYAELHRQIFESDFWNDGSLHVFLRKL